MALKRLPSDLQAKFRASTQIRSFKAAVEELVYNALDACSSSVAVRVDIKDNYIQVIDNGHGVAKNGFKILGERYTTSKFETSAVSDHVQLYGGSGQSLANLIEVSQSVKIISKAMNSKETWMKHFCNGKEKACSIITERPSVGTTVEIKGFLYNLTIQKKAVKELQELQNIKSFLEQIALIHCNTSISLRNNSLNEIVFQIHKNRDILKTVASVLNISTSNLQEFQVEKNDYKVTGFIQNMNEEAKGYQWIYVNGRFIDNSNLHNMVNENLAKGASFAGNIKTKVLNSQNYNSNDEKANTKTQLPDYFIFIKCPKNDYDVVSNYKLSILEFKNVFNINKLLEKLVKFHMGDIPLVKMTAINKEPNIALESNKAHEAERRNKIKQIMQKFLDSKQKKLDGSNLLNGVKGKIMRRKVNKKCGPLAKAKLHFKVGESGIKEQMCEMKERSLSNKTIINNKTATACQLSTGNPTTNKKIEKPNHQYKKDKHLECLHNTRNASKKIYNHINREPNLSFLVTKNKPLANKKIAIIQHKQNTEKQQHATKICQHNNIESVLSQFEKEPNSLHKRRNRLAKKVDHLLRAKIRKRYKIFTHETVRYSSIITKNKSISVRKKINEIIIHEYFPLSKKTKVTNKDNVNVKKDIKKSDDLLNPVTNIMKMNHKKFEANLKHTMKAQVPTDLYCLHLSETYVSNIPGPTYQSHSYLKDMQAPPPQITLLENLKKNQFISKKSRDYLASPIADRKTMEKQKVINDIHHTKTNNFELTDLVQTSYSVHFTKTNSQICYPREGGNTSYVARLSNDNNYIFNGSTYTIAQLDKLGSTNHELNSSRTCFIETASNHAEKEIRAPNERLYSERSNSIPNTPNDNAVANEIYDNNVIFISNSQVAATKCMEPIEPITICEAVIGSYDDENQEEIIENTFILDRIDHVFQGHTEIQAGRMLKLESESRRNLTICEDNRVDDSHRYETDCLNNKTACELDAFNHGPNKFNLKDRRRYIPKGMSPILENCNLKNVHNYELDADYFESAVYNNFAQNVHIHSEIFEPIIQTVKEAATRDIQRVDIKFNKDNACLTFNAGSLQSAMVLGQVDSKFIATILNKDSNGAQCLVILDQHAVHERIRLEQNMADYISEEQWKSVQVDGFSLKLSTDEILYLHNYRDKFERLGLEWSVSSDTQVLVNAIPEAILGKHPRQVDIVLKAVTSLIKEEISIIKEQGGCVSLYPKSIMDLVFSEACRYAIMFGTILTLRECSTLIKALSRCRMPFQCAHGRPALAVLVDVAQETHPYTVRARKENLD